MKTERPRTSRLPRLALPPVIATGCLLLAIAVGGSGVFFVAVGQVVPGWVVSAALLFGALVLARVTAVRRRATSGRTTVRRTTPSRVVRGLLAAVAALVSAFGLLRDIDADYHVLRPTGPDGCRAVVREGSFLLAGEGEVYAVGPFGLVRRPSGSWRADDGYRPIAEGTYELTWDEDGGTLTVSGDEVNPVMDGTHRVDCD